MGRRKLNRDSKNGSQAQQNNGASDSCKQSGLHKVLNSSDADNTRQDDHKQKSAVHNEGQKSSFNPSSHTGHQLKDFPPLQPQATSSAWNFQGSGKPDLKPAKFDTAVGKTDICNISANEASAIHTLHWASSTLENETKKDQECLSELITMLCNSKECNSTFAQILCEIIASHGNKKCYINKLRELANTVQQHENIEGQQQHLQRSALSAAAQEFKSKETLNVVKQEQPDAEDNWEIGSQNDNVCTGYSHEKSEEVEKMEVCATEETPEGDWFDNVEPDGERREREQSNDRHVREQVNRGQNRNYQQEREGYNGNNRGRQRHDQNWRGGQDVRGQERDRRHWNQDRGYDDRRKHQTNKPGKVNEVTGDLFEAPKDYSLAHCVATDLRMGSGIAVTFRQTFKKVSELLDQRKRVGEVAILEDNGRFIYYLITKKFSNGKPRFDDLISSLEKMRDHCVENGVKNLAMPRIGCGLDRLEWREVKPAIEKVFSELDINVVVYNFNPDLDEASKNYSSKSYCKITHASYTLDAIERGTALIYFGYEDGEVDDSGIALDKKFNFLFEYRKQKKVVGTVIRIQKNNEILYGCIINKRKSDTFSYVNFEKCLNELRKLGKKDDFYYYGIQAFYEDGDEATMEKIITVLRNAFVYLQSDIYICWPKELHNYSADVEKGEIDNSAHYTHIQKFKKPE